MTKPRELAEPPNLEWNDRAIGALANVRINPPGKPMQRRDDTTSRSSVLGELITFAAVAALVVSSLSAAAFDLMADDQPPHQTSLVSGSAIANPSQALRAGEANSAALDGLRALRR